MNYTWMLLNIEHKLNENEEWARERDQKREKINNDWPKAQSVRRCYQSASQFGWKKKFARFHTHKIWKNTYKFHHHHHTYYMFSSNSSRVPAKWDNWLKSGVWNALDAAKLQLSRSQVANEQNKKSCSIRQDIHQSTFELYENGFSSQRKEFQSTSHCRRPP